MANFNYYPFGLAQNMQNGTLNGSFVSVRSIEEAFNWPVAPGNSITFKDENQPYVYTKTKGFSPLEQPVFEKYKLVKVEDAPVKPQNAPQTDDSVKDELALMWKEINALKAKYGGLGDVQPADDKPIQTVHAKSRSVHGSDGDTTEYAE